MEALKLTPDDVRGVADLPKLPILTRRDVRENFKDLTSTAPPTGEPMMNSTGGTTGEPLRTATDLRGTAWGNAAYFRGLSWAGFDFDRDKLAVLSGGSLTKRRGIANGRFGSLSLLLSAMDVRADRGREYYDSLRAFRPDFLKGYSNATYLLARAFKQASLPSVPLKAVFATSEHLPEYQRRYIEEVFNTKVYGYYGSVEINSIGYQCPHREGYHIPEEHVIVETIQDGTEKAAEALGRRDGGGGAFAITDLDNYYMPMLRYRNGDAGVLTDDACPCGRTLKRIRPLFGRVVDLLRSTDGSLIPGGIVDFVVGKSLHIREVCLVQEAESLCRLQYVADRSDHEVPGIISQLQAYLGRDMRIIAEGMETIPLTLSGKRRFTICRLHEVEELAQGEAVQS
jgi:phenylacetate-CoA ligase